MERTFTMFLTDEEEKQLQELVELFKEYQAKTGKESDNIEKSVFDMWIRYGLGLHMAENYNYFKSVLKNQLKGDAA